MPERVLVVDDDAQMRKAVTNALKARGYQVLTAGSGEAALAATAEEEIDLVLLDLGLPGIEGREVIERLRSWSDLPIIVISVRESQEDKVAALDAGADDFVTKPFGMKELLARMRAVRRRATTDGESLPILRFDSLEINLPKKLVTLNDEGIHLTPTEYRLLEAMATNPGKLLTHPWLLRKVWGPGYGHLAVTRNSGMAATRTPGSWPRESRLAVTRPPDESLDQRHHPPAAKSLCKTL